MQNEYSKFLSFCHFCKRCHVKTVIWCCILTHIFFWLNTENNADSYIIKHQSLSNTRKCDNEPEGTLFFMIWSYFYLIEAMSWIPADPLQWTIHGKTKSRVYMSIKKTSTKLSRLSNTSLGKWKSIFFILISYSLSFTTFTTQIQ